MKLESPVFEHEGVIPSHYTCDSENVHPPLVIADVPHEAVSLALIMDDPDAPGGVWDHWTAWNIPTDTTDIPEGINPAGIVGKNSWGVNDYGGPCPPDGEHRYVFHLYALDTMLDLDPLTTTKESLEMAIQPHILTAAKLMGRYRRKDHVDV